jgi:hypothetical protein
VRVILLLEENDLWDIVKDVVPLPTDPQQLVAHNKMEVKAKQMILDAIKDYMIPHISKKKTMKEMFDALVMLEYNGCARLTIDNITIVTQP